MQRFGDRDLVPLYPEFERTLKQIRKVMSLKVIYFQSTFLIDFYIIKTDLYAGIWINFTKLLCSREFKRKQKLQ